MTANNENVTHSPEYRGMEKVTIGNGNKVNITHVVGQSFLASHTGLMNLENILCVPNMTKNLVSVSQLSRDNDIYLNFMLIIVL